MARFLLPSLDYDRPAIMRAAWAQTRAAMAYFASQRPERRRVTTLRAEFATSLRDVWDTAKAHRANAVFFAEQAALAQVEAARVAALEPHARKVEIAAATLFFAERSDAHGAHAAIAAARADLARLQFAA